MGTIDHRVWPYLSGSGKSACPWPRTAFAAPKDKFTLYAMARSPAVAELLPKLGKYKTGGGCIYIRWLSDIDESVLRQIIAAGLDANKALHPT